MKTLIKYELIKSIHNKKNWAVMFLYTVVLIAFLLSCMSIFIEKRNNDYDFFTQRFYESAGRVAFYESPSGQVHFDENYESDVLLHTMSYESYLVDMSTYGELMKIFLNNNRTREFELHRERVESDYKYQSTTFERYGAYRPGNANNYEFLTAFMKAQKDFFDYCAKNDISILYEYEMTGFNFLYQSMHKILPYVLLLIIFLSITDIFTSENQSGSYKILLLQPVSRLNIFISKIISSVITSMTMVLGPLMFVFILTGLVNGFGSAQYPVLLHRDAYASITPLHNDYIDMQPNWDNSISRGIPDYYRHTIGITPYSSWRAYDFLDEPNPELMYYGMLPFTLLCLPVYFSVFLLAAAVSAFFSVLSQKNTLSLVLCVAVGVAVFAFPSPKTDISFLVRFNPYIYLNPAVILNGIGSTTALMGILVLLSLSALLLSVGAVIFNKRDIKC